VAVLLLSSSDGSSTCVRRKELNRTTKYFRISVMCVRLLSFIVILCGLSVAGCTGQRGETVFPKRRPLGKELDTFEAPAKPGAAANARPIAEATGVITLRQALALALMHNRELKVFSWDVRISQARQLQASLPPNPELEVEVEEVGGPGDRSGFDGAETTIQLSQLIELGDKRKKRRGQASGRVHRSC